MMVDGGDWQARIAEDARRHRELHERLSGLSISETSRDGAVRVTVSATGLLTGLVVAETVEARDVGERVLDCLRRAQARIPDLLRQAVTDSFGATDPNANLLVAEARQRFPEPPPLPEQRGWQPEEIRFTVPENPTAAAVRPVATPVRQSRQRRVQEETWDEWRSVLKDV